MFTDAILNIIMILSFSTAIALMILEANANIGELLLKKEKKKVMNSDLGMFLIFNIFIRDWINDSLNDLFEGGKEWILKYLQTVAHSKMRKKKQAMTVQQRSLYGKMAIK